jgi:multidrug efflux pump subunit AcrA (membrane-fusion protein)
VKKIIIILVILAVIGGGVLWKKDAITSLFSKEAQKLPETDRLYTAAKMSFKIVINEQGTLTSKKSTQMKVPHTISRQVKIVWLIEDGAKVKKGDKVVELDKQEIENAIMKKEESLVSLKKKLELAEEKLKLEKEREDVKWKASQDALDQAIKNKDKYNELEAPKQFADKQVQIQKAQEGVDKAHKSVEDAQEKVSEELFMDEKQREKNLKDLENKKRQYQTSLKQLESAQLNMKIFRRHTHKEKLKSLDDAITNRKMNLEDAKISAKSDINEAQNSVDQIKIQIKQSERNLTKDKKALNEMIVKAPTEGIVHIGDANARRWGSHNQIEVGKDVWRGRVLAHIPDTKNFEVTTDIPENTRSKVKKGLEATIKLPAIPDLALKGKIYYVATKAHHRISWDRSSPKVFNIKINVDSNGDNGGDGRIVSGMTARIEIFVDEIKDVLAVPVESVFVEEDKNFVYKQTNGQPEKVYVTTKQSNENFVAIEGLEEGDRVYLFDPYK